MTGCNSVGAQHFEALTQFVSERLVPMHVSCDTIDTFRAGAHFANLWWAAAMCATSSPGSPSRCSIYVRTRSSKPVLPSLRSISPGKPNCSVNNAARRSKVASPRRYE
jgi:hypothetical protein